MWKRGCGGGGPRHQAAVAAGAGIPARWLIGGTHERDSEQQQVQEGVEGALVGEIGRSNPRFAVEALNDADGQHGERQRR
jgi:hypothetical protein